MSRKGNCLDNCMAENFFGLNGKNWIKTQYLDKRTGEPIANRKFIIYVIMGEEDSDIGEIITRSDENGYVYVKNIPDGECYGDFLDED